MSWKIRNIVLESPRFRMACVEEEKIDKSFNEILEDLDIGEIGDR